MKKVLLPITILLFFLSDANMLFANNRRDSVFKMADVDMVISLDKALTGFKIPDDFVGLSFETGSVRKNNAHVHGYFFSPQNVRAVNIFKLLGIKNLRIGGGAVDFNKVSPTFADIDQLFGFAKLTDIKVVYSLRLLNGSIEENVKIARYIWSNYKDNLQCFAIGNEPDWDSYKKIDPEIKDYPTYLAKWKRMVNAIVARLPGAKFAGPDTGSNYPVTGAKNTCYMQQPWTVLFGRDLKASNLILYLAQHNYVGQDALGRTIPYLISNMLAASWPKVQYPRLLDSVLHPMVDMGYKYRLTESNSFSSAVAGASNSNATALFALDYLHWWSQHGCSGVNFHNKQWVLNAPILMDADGSFQMAPVCYGIKAFEVAGKGVTQPLKIANTKNINCTAYAVRSTDGLYITVINKENGNAAVDAHIQLSLGPKVTKAKYIALSAPNVTELTGLKIGGAELKNDGNCAPRWEGIKSVSGNLCVKVPACSAMIIKITY